MITWLTSHYINYSQASGLKSLPNISLYIFISFSLLFFNSRSHFCNHRGTSLLAPFDNSATYSTLNKCLKLNALLPFQSFPWLCHSLPTECKPGHVWKSLSMKKSHYKGPCLNQAFSLEASSSMTTSVTSLILSALESLSWRRQAARLL